MRIDHFSPPLLPQLPGSTVICWPCAWSNLPLGLPAPTLAALQPVPNRGASDSVNLNDWFPFYRLSVLQWLLAPLRIKTEAFTQPTRWMTWPPALPALPPAPFSSRLLRALRQPWPSGCAFHVSSYSLRAFAFGCGFFQNVPFSTFLSSLFSSFWGVFSHSQWPSLTRLWNIKNCKSILLGRLNFFFYSTFHCLV